MSANVYYSAQRKGICLEGDANDYLRRKMQSKGINELPVSSQGYLYSYLEGLRDAGVSGAKELIEFIEEHSNITIWLEY